MELCNYPGYELVGKTSLHKKKIVMKNLALKMPDNGEIVGFFCQILWLFRFCRILTVVSYFPDRSILDDFILSLFYVTLLSHMSQ